MCDTSEMRKMRERDIRGRRKKLRVGKYERKMMRDRDEEAERSLPFNRHTHMMKDLSVSLSDLSSSMITLT